MTIAKKYAQQYMPNGEVSLEQVIQAAIDEALMVPEQATDKLDILFITNAYESGIGHAYDDLCNPYKAESDGAVAYDIGKKFGKSRGIGRPVAPQPKKEWE